MGSNSLTLAPAPRSAAAEQVRAEVREFLAAELAAGSFTTHVDTWLSGVDPAFSRKLGQRGWLGMTWPKEYGGAATAATTSTRWSSTTSSCPGTCCWARRATAGTR